MPSSAVSSTPRWSSRQRVRISAYSGFIVIGIGGTILGPALLQLLSDYQMPPSGAGALFFAGTAGYMLAVLTGGPASDRIGKGFVLATGAVVYALGLAGVALAPSWLLAVLAFFIAGAGNGSIDSGMNALTNDNSPPEGHAREQSLLHAFFGLGALLGPLLIGLLLAAHRGWRPAYLLDGAGAAVLFLLLLGLRVPARAAHQERVALKEIVALTRSRQVALFCGMIGLYVGAELVIGDWGAAYLQRVQDLNSVVAATSLSLFWAALMVGRLLSALLTRWYNSLQLLSGSIALSLIFSVLLVLAPTSWVALLALIGCGLGFAAVFPLLMALAGERFPHLTGSMAGLLTAAAALAGALLPWIGGVLVQAYDARAAIILAPLCSAGMLVGLTALQHRERRVAPAVR
jgi:fucose permease